MKAVGYQRVSTTDQALEGHSLDAQREAIARFAAQRGWELVEVYEDAGITGTSSDRPALCRLLDDAAQGRFDVVIVHAVDRFYRDLQGLFRALNHLRLHDVAFISITENIDFTTPWGKLTLAVLGTLAEIYIDKLSEETKKGKRARASKGLYNGSVPLGYCRGDCSTCTDPNGDRPERGRPYCPRFGGPDLAAEGPPRPLYPHPIERHAVQLAYEWYATGDYADGQIAEKLNAHRHTLPDGTTVPLRTKGRNGRSAPAAFSKDSVREILQRVFYTGLVPYRASTRVRKQRREPSELYPGRHPALISQELYQRCQEVRALMGNHPRRHRNYTRRLYLLSGVLRCAGCKRKMRAQSGHGVRFYQDTTRLQHDGRCEQAMVNADEVEAQVARILLDLEVPPDWEQAALAYVVPPEEAERILEEQARTRDRLARLRQLYIEADIDREEYQRQKLHYHQVLARLTPVDYSAILEAARELAAAQARWATLTGINKKGLIRKALASVLLQGNTIVGVQPTLVFYPLFQHQEARRRNYGSDGI